MCAPFPSVTPDGGVTIDTGSVLAVDGVMNSLYDREMIPFLGNRPLRLRLTVRGRCKVSLFHRTPDGGLIQAGTFKTQGPLTPNKSQLQNTDVCIDFRLNTSEHSFGRWYFTVEALRMDVHLVSACWEVLNSTPAMICPAFVICTFKRERQVSANVMLLQETLAHVLDDYGVIVVDNARSLVRDSAWSEHVRLIPQRNVGGAGGFGRGIFEALQDERFTHIVMLDDDADIDGLSIVRMMNLFRLNTDKDLFIGGMQLDVYKPNKLADAGAYWRPDRFEQLIGRLAPTDLGSIEAKDGMARPHRSNFSGWWLFGGSAEGFRRFGFPIPCFVHLDDVEFGVRVSLRGGRTVTVPSIAVWHEPYYAKVEGWFAYYNIRNELVRLSLQAPVMYALNARLSDEQRTAARRSKRALTGAARKLRIRFRDFINSYQYGSAYLLARGIEDFLKGPSLFEEDAESIHRIVMEDYRRYNANYRLLPNLPMGTEHRNPARSGRVGRWLQVFSRNGQRLKVRGTPGSQVTVFWDRDAINWKWIKPGQDWGYYDPASAGFHLYRYEPDLYAAASKRFDAAIRKFTAGAAEAGPIWVASYDRMISADFWSNLVKSFDLPPDGAVLR